MIAFLKGKLVSSDENGAIIEVNGVGFNVIMPSIDINKLPEAGGDVFVYTYLYVREDVMDLFGFSNKESIKYFKKLISVSGVGPKAAVALLSALTPSELALAIISSDAKAIGKAKGIGPKMAQRIVLELKGKVETEDAIEAPSQSAQPTFRASADSAAVNALIALGSSPSEAQKTVMQISKEGNFSTEEIIREALRRLSNGI
ncbi:MAG: Holliday junction branch migration protein RuvA [Clostridia bacterium]|nr:Holliday junction branch migration protein RuvA [Clostridia bacterium]